MKKIDDIITILAIMAIIALTFIFLIVAIPKDKNIID